jgi:DMSO reductase family type II enzyme heme b subunit
MHDAYNSMHVDAYIPTNFVTAATAGNLLSQPHKTPVEDANARGFGSFKSQSLAQQNVDGKGLWHDGFWNVVFIRDLESKDSDDVKFSPGKPVPIAFAIWNGEQHDRNGRKMVSNWYQLIIDDAKISAAPR